MLASLLGLLAACGSKDTNLTEVNDGQPASITMSGKIVVQLEANPSTGYTWEVGELDTNILKQVGETEYKSSSPNPMPGSGGTQILRFQPVAPGTTTLKLVYHRPWETNVAPIKTFTLTVTVEK